MKSSARLWAVAVAGAALGVLGYRSMTRDLESPWWQAVPSVAVAWTFLVAGVIAHWRRPASRLGTLMQLVAFALLLRKFEYSGSSALFTLGFALSAVFVAAFGHAVLAYPSGHLHDRLERTVAVVAYAFALVVPIAILLVYDPRLSCLFDCSSPTRVRPESLLLVHGDENLVSILRDVVAVGLYGVLGAVFVVLIVRRLLEATPRARRMRGPLLLAGAAAGLRAISESVFSVVSRSTFEGLLLFSIEEIVQAAVPIVLLVGLLRERLARAGVADLLRELEETPPDEVAAAIGRVLGDPSLEVAFWMPARRAYADGAGRDFPLPEDDRARAVTKLEHDGAPIAALVHDPSLLEEPKLIEAVGAAARLALENARLHAELQAQLVKVRESRTRLVTAGDEERRRIERDLHDGAQQRLVALALELRLAQRELGGATNPAVERVLTTAVDTLQLAVNELRELAHGVHPAILTQAGIAAALEDLARRTPLAVTIAEAPADRLPADIEATAYFLVCEALANAVKHANASEVTISVVREAGMLVISVVDDGRGGANSDGQGLRGLADRIEARGGRLWVESPPGAGTRVVGEVPCAS